MSYHSENGRSFPLGAQIVSGGVNFSLFSRDATFVELLLFDDANDKKAERVVRLDPSVNRTGNYWHTFVPGLEAGQLYGYRVNGPYDPHRGLLFNPQKVLLDPYARAVVTGSNYSREAATREGDNVAQCMKSVVVDQRAQWQDLGPINRNLEEIVIYEMHVKGFTAHPSSGVSEEKRGTYAGVIEKIPYLQELGVTAVELLPIQQFDPQDSPGGNLTNYWGYSPISFFAVHQGYSSDKTPLGAIQEFRNMVRALHQAGIEVYLDVVFNHTAEGGWGGPTLSYKGIQNNTYYIFDQASLEFANYSGCGNTFNANNSVARRMIRDNLKYWAQEMHIDGFRFDLASILTRDSFGNVLSDPPVLWSIESDPVLAGTKIIAEAWDAAGLYQVGHFVGGRWQEWNGRFRDHVRRFIKGDSGVISDFADSVIGSPRLYYEQRATPHRSVNFVTAHDGFTLNDLVSYNDKHNEANEESNRDGENTNLSWNCGVEGPTGLPGVNRLRRRQMKNFISILMISMGTPMLSMGDEVCRTQCGNNNAYCQDNAISWFDWELVKKNQDMFRFTQKLIYWRRKRSTRKVTQPTLADMLDKTKIQWHGAKPFAPDWSDHSHAIAASILEPKTGDLMYVAVNAHHEDILFELPQSESTRWYRVIDTSLPGPEDVVDLEDAVKLEDQTGYLLTARSMLVLIAYDRVNP
ncbi:MAG: glycogen debranching enzyme GlgX [Proteobacteria bacterium]|nr:MAG: glycogen debranching enzyme GlgX [Pseudomonadota bacterium]PIE40034.1 MAG: glycogen debranching enzyme GlgX [Gammaproteobacteria bacterium]